MESNGWSAEGLNDENPPIDADQHERRWETILILRRCAPLRLACGDTLKSWRAADITADTGEDHRQGVGKPDGPDHGAFYLN